jgi:hypothetical protein
LFDENRLKIITMLVFYNLAQSENMNLKNSLIGLMLMAMSAGAMAEWTNIGHNADIDAYVDVSTIRKSGGTAKMWSLADEKKAQISASGKSYMSQMTRREYDCNEEKVRGLSIYLYSGNMKNGDMVTGGDFVSEWSSIPPESVSATQFKIACGAK